MRTHSRLPKKRRAAQQESAEPPPAAQARASPPPPPQQAQAADPLPGGPEEQQQQQQGAGKVKLLLQLTPLNSAAAWAMEDAWLYRRLEPTLSPSTRLPAVLRYLGTEWQEAAAAAAAAMAQGGAAGAAVALFLHPPPNCPDTLRNQRWGGPECSDELTIGDIHAMLRCPPILQLRYGWDRPGSAAPAAAAAAAAVPAATAPVPPSSHEAQHHHHRCAAAADALAAEPRAALPAATEAAVPTGSRSSESTDSQRSAAHSSQRRPHAPRVCAAPDCGATTGLHLCGGCGTVRYCSKACSCAHWRAHKAECRRLQAERAGAGGQS